MTETHGSDITGTQTLSSSNSYTDVYPGAENLFSRSTLKFHLMTNPPITALKVLKEP